MKIYFTEIGKGGQECWALWIRILAENIDQVNEFNFWVDDNFSNKAIQISSLATNDGLWYQDFYIFEKEVAMAFKLRWSNYGS